MTEPKIIFENDDFLAVVKPAGWLTHHVSLTGEKRYPTLTDYLVSRYPALAEVGDEPALRPGIVHRLDRETSGIIVVPKTEGYFLYLKSLFKERNMEKGYFALVHGTPKEKSGTIDAPIGIKAGTIRRTVGSGKMMKPAVTEYKVIERFGEGEKSLSLLEVYPKTGRTHQIRIHLKSIGCPIVGDSVYGRRKDKISRLMLHSFYLSFESEPGRKIRLEADPPEDFEEIIRGLRSSKNGYPQE